MDEGKREGVSKEGRTEEGRKELRETGRALRNRKKKQGTNMDRNGLIRRDKKRSKEVNE